MECGFDVGSAVGVGASPGVGIGVVTSRELGVARSKASSGPAVGRLGGPLPHLLAVVDAMGTASAKAQGLGAVITTSAKLMASDHRLYMAVGSDRRTVLGLLKVAAKHLFIRTETGAMKELDPLCVLDFYVHESCQRQGLGIRLFEAMLEREGARPAKLAYDRPSPKLLAFLGKYFGLKAYTPQANNFVVYHQYFHDEPPPRRSSGPFVSVASRPLSKAGRRDAPAPSATTAHATAEATRYLDTASRVMPLAASTPLAATGDVIAHGRRAGSASSRRQDHRSGAAAASRAVAAAYSRTGERPPPTGSAGPGGRRGWDAAAAPPGPHARTVHVSTPAEVPGLAGFGAAEERPATYGRRSSREHTGSMPLGGYSSTTLSRPF